MTGEGGEYGGRRREGHHEHEEDEDPRKEARELVKEVEREVEREQSNEGEEKSEQSEDEESRREAQDLIDEAREESKREQAENEADEQQERHWESEAEKCVKDAVREYEREDAEEKKAREEVEEEYREFQERGREARAESAEDDNLSEWEKDVLENYEKYGIDPEEVRELWREQFAKDVEDELDGPSDEPDMDEKKEGEPDEETGQRKTEDTESYHDDGSGQMYATKSESSEQAESKAESETTEETQKDESEPRDAPEGATSKESTEPKNLQSEDEESAQPEEGNARERPRNSDQEGVEDPKPPENVPKKSVATEYQEKETPNSVTTEYSEDIEEKQSKTKSEKKIESSSESEEDYGGSEEAKEDIETTMNQEIQEEESTESDSLDEISPIEEKWQRDLDEIFNKLPEELQEAIRKYLKEKVEDEEDFEELAKKHGLEDILEDEEAMEEIRKFLRYKKAHSANPEASMEDLAEEVGIDAEQAEKWTEQKYHPEALKKVLRLEGYRVLDNLLRGFKEMGYPEDREDIERALENNPRLEFEDPMAPFEQWKKEAIAWTEITKMRRKGKIKIKLRNGRERYDREQIESLSKKYGISKERIVSWLLGESVPVLIEKIRSRGFRRDVSKSEVFDIDDLVGSVEKFEQALAHNNELRLNKRFDNQYRDVLVHYILQEGDIDFEDLSKQYRLSRWNLLKLRRQKPWLLRELHNRELRRLYVEANGALPEVKIESMEDLVRLLSVHQDLQQEDYEDCEKYFEVLQHQGKTLNELSETVSASRARINWWTTVKAPKPIPKLRTAEENRIINEWVKSETFRYSFSKMSSDDETQIPQRILIQGEFKKWKLPNLIDLIKQLSENLRNSGNRVIMTEFQPESSKVMPAITKMFKANQKKLKTLVEKQMGSDGAQLALVDNRLYIWNRDRRLLDLINLYGEMNFYFSNKDEFAKFIADVKEGIEGKRAGGLYDVQMHLEKLISQVFNSRKKISLYNEKRINVFRIRGEHLHLLLDIAGMKLSSLEGRIERVTDTTGHGGIWHPKFPEGEKLLIILSRLFATVACDGHIQKNGIVHYYETELNRIDLVQQNLRGLGDIKLKPMLDKRSNCYVTSFLSVISQIPQKMGLLVGDKTIQNPTLKSEFLESFSWRALCAFVEDSVCEDGSVMPGRIWWTHSCSLHPGDKIEDYDFDPVVDSRDISFIKDQGIESESNWRLAMGKLRKLRKSKDSGTAQMAKRLYDTVYANPNKLVEIEKTIIEKLGIKVRHGPASIYYHKKSQSVSVAWICHTKGADEAMALAMIAPPNDVLKRSTMKEWIKDNPKDAERVLSRLKQDDIEVQQWWLEE